MRPPVVAAAGVAASALAAGATLAASPPALLRLPGPGLLLACLVMLAPPLPAHGKRGDSGYYTLVLKYR